MAQGSTLASMHVHTSHLGLHVKLSLGHVTDLGATEGVRAPIKTYLMAF